MDRPDTCKLMSSTNAPAFERNSNKIETNSLPECLFLTILNQAEAGDEDYKRGWTISAFFFTSLNRSNAVSSRHVSLPLPPSSQRKNYYLSTLMFKEG